MELPENLAEMLWQTVSDGAITIDHLPTEILDIIFSYLDIKERVQTELVCRRWRTIGKEQPWMYPTTLVLDRTHHDNAVKSIQYTDGVIVAILSRCGKNLTHISVRRCRESSSEIPTIIGKYCPNLLELKLYDLALTRKNCKTLAQGCPKLTSITLCGMIDLTENELSQWLQRFEMLESLELAIFGKVDGTFCNGLNPKLKALGLSVASTGLPNYSSIMEILMSRCPNLQSFSLNFHNPNILTSMYLVQPEPELLMKLFCHYEGTLKSVFVNGYLEDIDWRTVLTVLSNLEELSLCCCRVDDELLSFVAENCVKLKSLNVSGNFITDDGIESLAILPALKVLDVSQTQVCGEGVAYLARQGRLEELCVRSCKNFKEINCRDVAKYCHNLRLLDVSGTAQITTKAVNAFWKVARLKYFKGNVSIIVGGTSVSRYKMKTCRQLDVCFYSTERNLKQSLDDNDDGCYAWADFVCLDSYINSHSDGWSDED